MMALPDAGSFSVVFVGLPMNVKALGDHAFYGQNCASGSQAQQDDPFKRWL
jgi:hypothetical protein